MRYCRFSTPGSDVYVLLHVDGFLSCCGCPLDPTRRENFETVSTDEMIEHLLIHRILGDKVPEVAFKRLRQHQKNNDAWMKLSKRQRRSA